MDPRPPASPDANDAAPPPRDAGVPTGPRRLSRRAQVIGGVIALLVVAGVGWLAWSLTHQPAGGGAGGPGAAGTPGAGRGPGGGNFGAAGGRGATTVGVATVQKADIPVTVEALGTVVPQSTVRVRPQVSGVLQQIHFKEGQMVKKGDLLATIDPRQFEMTLQQATGQRMKDEAQLAAAKVTLQRYQTLLQQDSIARQDVDTQEALVKQLEATLVVDRANEGAARLNLGYTRIVAPIAGRVGLRTVDIGNYVGTSDANGVALITSISPIDVEFAVPQDQAPALQANAGAYMEAKALDRTRQTVLDTGVFTSLDNQVDTQTGTVRAKARFNNTKLALFPSQFVNVQLAVRTIKDAIVIPVSALRHGNNGDYVFLLNEDRTVTQRPVTAGQATVDKVQVTKGVQVGDRVITEGADRLRDGSRVILPGDNPGPGGRGGGGGRRHAASGASAGGGSAGGASAPAEGASGAPAQPRVRGSEGAPPQRRNTAQDATNPGSQAPAAAPPAAPRMGGQAAGPTPEQRQRMLDAVKDDPQQLARRKAFLEMIDRGDPDAMARWQQMQQQRRAQQGGQ